MAVGNLAFPSMPPIKGVQLAATNAGIKKNSADDLVLIQLPETAVVAGVFTQNDFCAAPVTLCREHLSTTNNTRFLIINSGNANACTGEQGMLDAIASCEAIAKHQPDITRQQVLPFSTGVIGEPLPVDKIVNAIPAVVQSLDENNWRSAATGIMTTDTMPKGATETLSIAGETITINGIAKGAGMINPNMATMLAFVATDVALSEACAQALVKEAADLSFNRITIDGDTSTNDSCMLMAAGTAKLLIDDIASDAYQKFKAAFVKVMSVLAQAIVKDGEGASKFLTININGGKTANECLDVAYSIAHSPLVKTALFASDPNWGRIVCAIGYAGVQALDVNQIKIYLDEVLIVENGGRAASYTEEAGQQVMDQSEINLRVELARGNESQTLWTSDLSHEYVRINAEYRS